MPKFSLKKYSVVDVCIESLKFRILT